MPEEMEWKLKRLFPTCLLGTVICAIIGYQYGDPFYGSHIGSGTIFVIAACNTAKFILNDDQVNWDNLLTHRKVMLLIYASHVLLGIIVGVYFGVTTSNWQNGEYAGFTTFVLSNSGVISFQSYRAGKKNKQATNAKE